MEGSLRQFEDDLCEHLKLCDYITTKLETTNNEIQCRADKQSNIRGYAFVHMLLLPRLRAVLKCKNRHVTLLAT